MNKLQILLFCGAALCASAGLAAVLFSYTTVPSDTVRMAGSAQPMESFADVDLGADFGTVPVAELVGYYLENPPKQSAEPEQRRKHFGGC